MATKRENLAQATRSKRTAANLAGSLGILLLVAEVIVQAPTFRYDEAAQGGFFARGPQPVIGSSGAAESRFEHIIRDCSRLYGVELALVKAVIRAESGFNPSAISRSGARGLMQLMPKTARKQGVRDAHDPKQNIAGGVRYLRDLLDRFDNNMRLALAAYNAGAAAVKRHRGLPPYRETRTYVARVLRYRQQYLREQRPAEASGRA